MRNRGYTMCSHISLQISTKSTPIVIDKWWESLNLPLVPDKTYVSGIAFVNDYIRVACILQIFHNFINLQDARHLLLAIDQ
jgi:hypothetical protein